MPRGDRTGPAGLGPKTGRGAGYCAGNAAPGYMSAPGGGMGYGRGRGRGFGFRNMRRFALSDEPVAAPVAPEEKKPDNQSVELQELALLKHRVDGMTQTLDAIRQHLNTLPESGTTTITK